MALHHKIKPQHHISICGFSILLFLGSIGVYFNASDSLANQNGPSQKTKQFFGAGGGGGGYQNPAECEQAQQQEQADFQAISNQMQQIQSQMREKESQMNSATTPEQQEQIRSEMQQLQQQAQELQAQMSSMEGDRSQSGSNEPSTACKQAIVNMMKSEMGTFKSLINSNILPTFTKVDTTVASIESKIPALKESGQDPALISKIETNIASIKTHEATLKDFFQYMINKIDAFLNQANTDTDAAFNGMQKQESASEAGASSAADSLVSAFEELEALVNQLK